MVRTIGGFIAGVLVLGAVVITLQQVSAGMHPLPDGLDPMDPGNADALARHLEGMPVAAWVIAFLSELLGAGLGATAGGWIARERGRIVSALIVGLAVMGSLANWTSFVHPMWFMVGQLIGYPAALMGAWAVLQRRRPPAEAGGRTG